MGPCFPPSKYNCRWRTQFQVRQHVVRFFWYGQFSDYLRAPTGFRTSVHSWTRSTSNRRARNSVGGASCLSRMQVLSSFLQVCGRWLGRDSAPRGSDHPPGRIAPWLPAASNGRKRRIADFLASLPYFFGTMLDDVDLQTQLLAIPGDGFLIVCPRQEGERSNAHRRWLFVYLANNETIIKVNIVNRRRKFVLAKERNVTLAQFIQEQETNTIERPFFISPDQLTAQMPITPNLPFPIPPGIFSLGAVSQRTLNFDDLRRIPVLALDCSALPASERQKVFDEARRMLTFGSIRIWRLWGIVSETDSLVLVLEDIVYGSLAEYVRQGYRLESQQKRFTLQMAEGLRYMEKFEFVHRRLSIDVFLLTYSYNVKLAVMGLDDVELVPADELLEDIDWCRWTAPECLPAAVLPGVAEPPADRVPYGLLSMVYSFGTCVWSAWHGGALPFEDQPPENIRDRAFRTENPPEVDEEFMPREIAEVCHRCWSRKASHRLRFKELKSVLRRLQDSFHF